MCSCIYIYTKCYVASAAPRINEITFPSASQGGRRVVFVTERCVMELRQQRLVLTELANGMSTAAAPHRWGACRHLEGDVG